MSFTRSRNPLAFMYSIIVLNSSHDSFMDLGITFDRSLSFQPHIEKVTCKARKLLGFVKIISAKFKL